MLMLTEDLGLMTKLVEVLKQMIDSPYIHVFILCILLDLFTGLVKAFIGKSTNSTKGLMGVVKHMLVMLVVFISTPYLVVLGYKYIALAFLIFYIVHYAISITENLAEIGVPFPGFVKSRLEKVKNKIDKGEIK